MSELKTAVRVHPCKQVPGVHFCEPNITTLEALESFSEKQEKGQVSDDDALLFVFANIVCDSEGNTFDNCQTLEGIKDCLTVSELMDIRGELESFLSGISQRAKGGKKK